MKMIKNYLYVDYDKKVEIDTTTVDSIIKSHKLLKIENYGDKIIQVYKNDFMEVVISFEIVQVLTNKQI